VSIQFGNTLGFNEPLHALQHLQSIRKVITRSLTGHAPRRLKLQLTLPFSSILVEFKSRAMAISAFSITILTPPGLPVHTCLSGIPFGLFVSTVCCQLGASLMNVSKESVLLDPPINSR
jgi:hypothetical protein